MCNAYNHPIWCMCGWGGEGYGNGAFDNIWLRHQVLSLAYPSYVSHNAKCPVCQAPVYFYQSPDGGRVFFDDLGPPWPKHPCTSSDNKELRDVVVLSDSIGLDVELMAIGRGIGWKPFISTYIRKLPGHQLRIHGRFYRYDGRPGLETFLDTLDIDGMRAADLEHFHGYASGLPFFVREHAVEGYFDIAEIDLLAKHAMPEKVRARETHPVVCTPPENGLRRFRRELRA